MESGHSLCNIWMVEKKRSGSKRIKLDAGDLFEFTVSDGRLGYGIIVKRGGLKNGGTPYIAIFGGLHVQRPVHESIIEGEIVLAGWSMDALFYHGRWRVIGSGFPIPNIPFPNFKVQQHERFWVTDVEGNIIDEPTVEEEKLLDYQFSRAPIGFQNAFEALNGLQDWADHFDCLKPAHSEARITRP